MGLFSDNIGLLAASSSGAGVYLGHPIENSCRFNDNDSAALTRTPSGASNRKTWTWSSWIKRGNLGIEVCLFSQGSTTSDETTLTIDSSNRFRYLHNDGGGNTDELISTLVLRDPSAWYHIVIAVDTTEATDTDRVKIWINNEQITVWSASNWPALNMDTDVNSTASMIIGNRSSSSFYFDGYMAEVVFIDGQALDPTSFGEFNSINMWVPKSVSGLTFGTNGFHLDFANSSDIGNDVSGNGNDFTPSGLAAADIMSDTPTNNFSVINPLSKNGTGSFTYADGNLQVTVPASNQSTRGTIGVSTGKWYWECELTTLGSAYLGMVSSDAYNVSYVPTPGFGTNSIGDIYVNGSLSSADTIALAAGGAIYGMAVDMDAGKFWWSKNGQWYSADTTPDTTISIADVEAGNQAHSFTVGGVPWHPLFGTSSSSSTHVANFGQSPSGAGGNSDDNGYGDFDYPVPTGFLALCTANLGTPTIEDPSAHFDVALYTGNGTAIGSGGNEISDLSFQPDFVWIKNRDAADQHILTDAVRGATKYISSDGTDVEATEAETLASFDTDGFTVGNDVQVNTNTEDYVAWCWKAGGSGSVNGDGTISSTVSVNTTAGFSIVKYIGNGTGGATVGHGLGAVPGLIIVKNLDQTDNWAVYHHKVASDPETDYLRFDTTAAVADLNTIWNDTAPTSTVFSVGTSHLVNASTENYIAYCFAEIDGFSRIGSYTGNGSTDGPFVWCGFRPTWIMFKNINNASAHWIIHDTALSTYNTFDSSLYANLNQAEDNASLYLTDFLSNGFKIRDSYPFHNGSTNTIIFAAFAEHPFAYARAR